MAFFLSETTGELEQLLLLPYLFACLQEGRMWGINSEPTKLNLIS